MHFWIQAAKKFISLVTLLILMSVCSTALQNKTQNKNEINTCEPWTYYLMEIIFTYSEPVHQTRAEPRIEYMSKNTHKTRKDPRISHCKQSPSHSSNCTHTRAVPEEIYKNTIWFHECGDRLAEIFVANPRHAFHQPREILCAREPDAIRHKKTRIFKKKTTV